MPSFDKIAELLALTNALGSNGFRDAQTKAMQLGTMANAAQLPTELAMQQQQAAMQPQIDQARLAEMRAMTQARTMENVQGMQQGLMGGLRAPMEASGINFQGFPEPLTPEEALAAFQLVTQNQPFPPELDQKLQYDPRLNALLRGLQQQ